MRKAIRWVWWSLAVAYGVNMAPVAGAQTPVTRDNNTVQSAPDASASPYHLISPPSSTAPQWLPVGPKSVPPARRLPPTEPYVTTCLVSIPGEERLTPVATPAPASSKAAAVKAAIERACGSQSKSVQVAFGVNDHATVHLTAATEGDANLLWDKIQALPELLPYSLDVDVELHK